MVARHPRSVIAALTVALGVVSPVACSLGPDADDPHGTSEGTSGGPAGDSGGPSSPNTNDGDGGVNGTDGAVVGDAGEDVHVDPGAPFTFLTYGDSRADGDSCDGNKRHMQLVAQMVKEKDALFTVHVGDMITGYAKTTCFVTNGTCTTPGSEGNFKAMIAPLVAKPAPPGLPVSFFPVIGNHDDNTGWYPDPCSGARICDVFDLPKIVDSPQPAGDPCGVDYPRNTYYKFRYGNAAFFALRVNSDYYDLLVCNTVPSGYSSCADYCKKAPSSAARTDNCYNVAQYDWLKSELAKADADPTIAHKFVLLHAPIYTSFEDHPPTTSAPWLSELFDTYHVGYVLNGHNHTYERTVPIVGGKKATTGGGTVYVTTFAGGVIGYSPKGNWFTAAANTGGHYMRIHVGAKVTMETVRPDGSVIDSF